MIVLISGTNRTNANSLKVAKVVEGMLQEAGCDSTLLDLATLPPDLFSPDGYATKPAAFAPFQDAITNAAGVLSIVPEYNGSFPGIMKYFIDMLKFPESLKGVPAAFVGLAAGEWGGLRSVEQLEMVFQYRSAHLFGKRVFLKKIHELLDESGRITDPEILDRLRAQATEFAAFCDAVKAS